MPAAARPDEGADSVSCRRGGIPDDDARIVDVNGGAGCAAKRSKVDHIPRSLCQTRAATPTTVSRTAHVI